MHLKQYTRHKQALTNATSFRKAYGERGDAVIRFEWRCWKRIIQADERHPWRPVLLPESVVIRRVYREDARAEEDWSLICSREAIARPVQRDEVDGKTALLHEYLISVTEVGGHYSISSSSQQPGPDGRLERVTTTQHFDLLETSHGSHRPRKMHTITSADDKSLVASLAMQVISHETIAPEDPGEPAAAEPGRVAHLFPTSSPEWYTPRELASTFDDWYKRLEKWKLAASSRAGCFIASDPKPVVNLIPLQDPRCPTASVCKALKREGWEPFVGKVTHAIAAPGQFDAVEAIKMKSYYQALRKIPHCLALTSRLPSRQPILYYRLLLAGVKTEPDLGNSAYKALAAGERARGRNVEPIQDEDDPDPFGPIEDETSSDDAIVVPYAKQAPKPKRHKPHVPSGGGGAGASGRSGSGGGAGSGGGGGGGVAPPAPTGGGGVAPPEPSGSSSSESDIPVPLPPSAVVGPGVGAPEAGDDNDVVVPIDGTPARVVRQIQPEWQTGLDGHAIKFDPAYRNAQTGQLFTPNWQIKCPSRAAHGPRCGKKRHVVPAHTAKHGDIEPLCFLFAWCPCVPGPGKTHGRTDPSVADVDRFAEERGAEVRDLLRRLEV